jgi:hypothetical protein
MESVFTMSRIPQKLGKLGKRLRRRTGRWGFRTLISLALIAAFSSQLHAADPVFTKNHKFRIPFQFDQAEMKRIGAAQIELHVSADQGRTWTRSSVASPQDGRFTYDADANGEFWFSVRTIDQQGKAHPDGRHTPGLKVIVDDTPPLFELRLREVSTGRVELSWQVDDDNIDLNALVLESREPGSAEWHPVQIRAAARGQTSWTIGGEGLVEVRGRAKDLAGNSVSAEDAIRVASNTPRNNSRPDFSKPVATLPDLQGAETPKTAAMPSYGGDRLPQIIGSGNVGPGNSDRGPSVRPTVPVSTGSSIAPPVLHDVARNYPPVPAGARLVNSKTFNIGYQIEDEGPSGIGDIDLFITEDGGRKWFNYGTDPDRRSPFTVTVPRDGTFGFAMRARSGVGLAADPPQPGEVPSINVVVDLAPPMVRLLPIRQGQGNRFDQVTIQWQADDQALADNPIAVYYAAQPNGPWEPISGWTANTGTFEWRIDPNQQRRLYIRVEARDAAGNLATATSPQPLFFDLAKPTAKIVDVEAVPSSAPR